jgi:hypothetical protein
LKLALWVRLEREAALAGLSLTAYLAEKLGKAVPVEVPAPRVEAPAAVPAMEAPIIEPVPPQVEVPKPTGPAKVSHREAYERGVSIHQAALLTGSTVSEAKLNRS